jgi:hypothetical protein
MSDVFQNGLPPSLTPNPPPDMPQAPGPGDAMAFLAPFSEPQSAEDIIKQLVLDRPLKLFIPGKERFPGYEFRIINSVPHEIAAAHNKGFREVTDPSMAAMFVDLVAGRDETGKHFRPLLYARPKEVGDVVRKRNRAQLGSIYAGMNPENRQFQSKYAKNAGSRDGSSANFEGQFLNIR